MSAWVRDPRRVRDSKRLKPDGEYTDSTLNCPCYIEQAVLRRVHAKGQGRNPDIVRELMCIVTDMRERTIMVGLQRVYVSEQCKSKLKEWLTKLLLAVEPEVAEDNDDLAHQSGPESGRSHRTVCTRKSARDDQMPGTNTVYL